MESCIHNGELYYVRNLEDFRGLMDDSVYEALEKVVYSLVCSAESEGYYRALDEHDEEEQEEWDLEKESLLDEISDLEDKVLQIETERDDVLGTVDAALIAFSDEKDLDALIYKLEELL